MYHPPCPLPPNVVAGKEDGRLLHSDCPVSLARAPTPVVFDEEAVPQHPLPPPPLLPRLPAVPYMHACIRNLKKKKSAA
jgi:hypothetical protein